MDPGWDWFIFGHAKPVRDWDWSSIEEVLGNEVAGGGYEVRFVPRRTVTVATEITGQLVILRRKPKIKVIKRNQAVRTVPDNDYEFNDSYQLTMLVNGDNKDLREKIAKLKNSVISAKLAAPADDMCTLSCVPLDDESQPFKLELRVIRLKKVR